MANNTVLIADSQKTSRQAFADILSSKFKILEAGSVQEASRLMQGHGGQLAAVILGVSGAGDAEAVKILKQWKEDAKVSGIPVIAAVSGPDTHVEAQCLELGAWDVVKGPYDAKAVCLRVQNVIARKELQALKHIQYIREYDELTGIYNQRMFLEKTDEMLHLYPDEQFAFVHLDIYQFHLVNQLYGIHEADRLLQHIADTLAYRAKDYRHFTYGRYLADIFCFCMPYEGESALIEMIGKMREDICRFKIEHVLLPVFGIYIVNRDEKNIITMTDRANLASKQCKGNYIQNYAFYDASISDKIVQEQEIVNTMATALTEEQFVLYIQPKYDLHMNMIDGGEVLTRWKIPGKRMLLPGEFIPVFERNGFIMKLDYYVWEHACQMIRKWLDEGRKPFPVSVNISRMSFYNPNLADVIRQLVEAYGVDPRLLHLELTESVYASNPDMIKETLQQLQSYGFCILMDDFGSGYSSLNTLKDIAVDILKIDMDFLSDSDMPGRGENILAAVVRMAKWLNIPVIAEGVEKESQAAFLRSIGCEFVQGYYFSKPIPVEEYERIAFDGFAFQKDGAGEDEAGQDEFWDASAQMDLMFSNMLQAVAIYEYVPSEKTAETIRVNDAYYELFGYSEVDRIGNGIQNAVGSESREEVIGAFESVSHTKGVARCEFCYIKSDGSGQWVEMKLKYVKSIGNRDVIFATMSDITDQKEIERELRKYRKAILASESKVETILVVDDIKMNRKILRNMFESEYNILEAANGKEALDIVYKNSSHINVILLDVIMPVMDGREFLRLKQKDISIANIPVVIITSDDSPQQQINALSMGANDYVVKPFIPEVVIRRVCNVLESQKRVGEVLQYTEDSSANGQHDFPAGLYNRNAAGKVIQDSLEGAKGFQAFLIIRIENIVQMTGRFGHAECEKAIQDFADMLRNYFRKSDILARYSRDEFFAFAAEVPSMEFLEGKCNGFMEKMNAQAQGGMKLECSIGAAAEPIGSGQDSFMELIGHADKALHHAGQKGKNQWYLYEGK